jgi:hypothetical protein
MEMPIRKKVAVKHDAKEEKGGVLKDILGH